MSTTVLIPVMARVFEELGVGATLYQVERWPLVIHEEHGLLAYEVAHGVVDDRYAYNARCIERARKKGVTVLGQHAGFSDLFIPVGAGRHAPVMVTGPFATARLTSTDLLERWYSVTGRQGRPSDPEFAQYLQSALATLTFDADQLAAFRRWLECLASLMSGERARPDLEADIEKTQRKMQEVRAAERAFRATHEMLDPRTSRIWSSPASSARLKAMGLSGFPERVAVALFASLEPHPHPVDELVRRAAFQRASVQLARRAGNAISGPISDHGVVLAVAAQGSKERTRRQLVRLTDEATALARRRFRLRLHVGTTARSASLPEQYQDALGAAQSALSRGEPMTRAESVAPSTVSLARLQRELTALVESDPRTLVARFDRYLEAVAARSGYLLEPTRGHLEVAFDGMMDALGETSALGARAFTSLDRAVKSGASHARTVHEVMAVYRQAVSDVAGAALEPTKASHTRSLRRAEEYMRQHYSEALSLKRVAKVGGFAPNYFSELFSKKLGVTFGAHLIALRVARAKVLLADTPLTFARVARLSGLSTPQYLSRVFRRVTGETPRACRARGVKRRKPWA